MIQIAIFWIWPYYLKTIISLIKQKKKHVRKSMSEKKVSCNGNTPNFRLEIRLQIISQVDCNLYFKNVKNFEKKEGNFLILWEKKRNSFFKRKSGISVYMP